MIAMIFAAVALASGVYVTFLFGKDFGREEGFYEGFNEGKNETYREVKNILEKVWGSFFLFHAAVGRGLRACLWLLHTPEDPFLTVKRDAAGRLFLMKSLESEL